jgi:hypothetical protein
MVIERGAEPAEATKDGHARHDRLMCQAEQLVT